MNYDTELLTRALKAELEVQKDEGAHYELDVYRFEDSRLKYALHIHTKTGTACLTTDVAEPIQEHPMFQLNFRFSELTISQSTDSVNCDRPVVAFYKNEISENSKQLTMSWVPGGYWYVWVNADLPLISN